MFKRHGRMKSAISRRSSNFGQMGPQTMGLSALESLHNFYKNLDKNPFNLTMPIFMSHIEYLNITMHFNFCYHLRDF